MVSRSLKHYDLLTPRTVKQFKSWTPLSAAGQLCCHNLLTSCWFMLENDWRRVCVVDVWLIVFGCCWDNRWLSGVSSLFFPWCPRLTSIRFSSWSFSEPGSGVQSGGAANGQLRAGRTATHGHPASRWDEATLFPAITSPLRSPLYLICFSQSCSCRAELQHTCLQVSSDPKDLD